MSQIAKNDVRYTYVQGVSNKFTVGKFAQVRSALTFLEFYCFLSGECVTEKYFKNCLLTKMIH